jgi:hypothetical protein
LCLVGGAAAVVCWDTDICVRAGCFLAGRGKIGGVRITECSGAGLLLRGVVLAWFAWVARSQVFVYGGLCLWEGIQCGPGYVGWGWASSA